MKLELLVSIAGQYTKLSGCIASINVHNLYDREYIKESLENCGINDLFKSYNSNNESGEHAQECVQAGGVSCLVHILKSVEQEFGINLGSILDFKDIEIDELKNAESSVRIYFQISLKDWLQRNIENKEKLEKVDVVHFFELASDEKWAGAHVDVQKSVDDLFGKYRKYRKEDPLRWGYKWRGIPWEIRKELHKEEKDGTIFDRIWNELDEKTQSLIKKMVLTGTTYCSEYEAEYEEECDIITEKCKFLVPDNKSPTGWRWFSPFFPAYVWTYHTDQGKIYRQLHEKEFFRLAISAAGMVLSFLRLRLNPFLSMLFLLLSFIFYDYRLFSSIVPMPMIPLFFWFIAYSLLLRYFSSMPRVSRHGFISVVLYTIDMIMLLLLLILFLYYILGFAYTRVESSDRSISLVVYHPYWITRGEIADLYAEISNAAEYYPDKLFIEFACNSPRCSNILFESRDGVFDGRSFIFEINSKDWQGHNTIKKIVSITFVPNAYQSKLPNKVHISVRVKSGTKYKEYSEKGVELDIIDSSLLVRSVVWLFYSFGLDFNLYNLDKVIYGLTLLFVGLLLEKLVLEPAISPMPDFFGNLKDRIMRNIGRFPRG